MYMCGGKNICYSMLHLNCANSGLIKCLRSISEVIIPMFLWGNGAADGWGSHLT